MQRLKAILFCSVLAAILPASLHGRGLLPGSPGIVAGPYLMQGTRTTQTIMWETRAACSGQVEYGRQTPLEHSAREDEKAAIHEVALRALEPETVYFYRVRSRCAGADVTSRIYSFQTAVRPESAYAFVVVGDNRSYFWRWKKIADRAYAERPDFVINVGDVVTNGNVKSQWVREFLRPAATLMHYVPTYVAIGNHERNARWYYQYVSYPPPENYYSFDYGNAHFTIIDSNEKFAPGSAQYKWIESDLAGSKASWKFVAHHHPPYSSDADDYGDSSKGPSSRGDLNIRGLVPLYEKYGVDVVWCGHIHDYERTWPLKNGRVDEKNGVIYIQSGGGGAELERFAPTRSWFTAKVLRNWQYCLVTIHGGTLRMMAYDLDGRLYDFLELKK